jgi:hypothetical protein
MRRTDGWSVVVYPPETVRALLADGEALPSPSLFLKEGPYGPFADAIDTLGEQFRHPTGTTDSYRFDYPTPTFLWGEGADAILAHAHRRLRPWNRAAEAAEAWVRREASISPYLFAAIGSLVALVLGYFLGSRK